MVKYREILRQRAMGVSVRNTAFSCRCSTATVRAVTTRAKAHGLEWPLPEEMNDAAIRAVIYPAKERSIDEQLQQVGIHAIAAGFPPSLHILQDAGFVAFFQNDARRAVAVGLHRALALQACDRRSFFQC